MPFFLEPGKNITCFAFILNHMVLDGELPFVPALEFALQHFGFDLIKYPLLCGGESVVWVLFEGYIGGEALQRELASGIMAIFLKHHNSLRKCCAAPLALVHNFQLPRLYYWKHWSWRASPVSPYLAGATIVMLKTFTY